MHLASGSNRRLTRAGCVPARPALAPPGGDGRKGELGSQLPEDVGHSVGVDLDICTHSSW